MNATNTFDLEHYKSDIESRKEHVEKRMSEDDGSQC